jgi:hypothetical protein
VVELQGTYPYQKRYLMFKHAIISEDGLYRYTLQRHWGPGEYMLFVMLNPSTADAELDDPTIRRCMGFAKREGFGGITVVNLYAYRATQPKELLTVEDPVGPNNDFYLFSQLQERSDGSVVVAWGTNAREDRILRFKDIARQAGTELYCLGTTKNGSPKHPLYISGSTPLEKWN